MSAQTGEPFSSPPADFGGDGDGLHVGDGGGTTKDADVRRERRLQARLSLLPLQGLDESSFLAEMDDDIEWVIDCIRAVSWREWTSIGWDTDYLGG